MIRIRFADIDMLPEAPLTSNGPVAAAFTERHVTTLREAAAWLRDAPYGPNTTREPLSVLRDGHGTCTTKHAAIIALADEIGATLNLVWGIYALDDTIIDGTGPILQRAGIPFVPNIHCFVETNGGAYIDLTQGNCTGKRRQIEDYLELVPGAIGADNDTAWTTAANNLITSDQRFGHITADTLRAVRDACVDASPVLCPTQT